MITVLNTYVKHLSDKINFRLLRDRDKDFYKRISVKEHVSECLIVKIRISVSLRLSQKPLIVSVIILKRELILSVGG